MGMPKTRGYPNHCDSGKMRDPGNEVDKSTGEKLSKYQENKFILGDCILNSLDLRGCISIAITRRNLILITGMRNASGQLLFSRLDPGSHVWASKVAQMKVTWRFSHWYKLTVDH